jgi:hypothetical protein
MLFLSSIYLKQEKIRTAYMNNFTKAINADFLYESKIQAK